MSASVDPLGYQLGLSAYGVPWHRPESVGRGWSKLLVVWICLSCLCLTPSSGQIEGVISPHNGGEGITVAGNLVPWGANLCIVPEDMLAVPKECECAEGGCPSGPCFQYELAVEYTEYNNAPTNKFGPDGGPYTNQLLFDNVAHWTSPEYPFIRAGEFYSQYLF